MKTPQTNKNNRIRPQVMPAATTAKEVVMSNDVDALELATAEHLNKYNSVVGLMLSMGDNIYSTSSSNMYEGLDAETASRVDVMFDELDRTYEIFGDHNPDIHGQFMGVDEDTLKTVEDVLEYYSKTSELAAEQIALPTTHLALLAMMPDVSSKDRTDILTALPSELIKNIESELLSEGIIKNSSKAGEVLAELQKQYLENPEALVNKFIPAANEDEEHFTVTETTSTIEDKVEVETAVKEAVTAEEELKSAVKEAVEDIASEASKATPAATTKTNSGSSSSSSSSSYSATEVIITLGLVGLGLFAVKKAYDHFSSDDIVVIDENVSAEDFGWEDVDYNDL